MSFVSSSHAVPPAASVELLFFTGYINSASFQHVKHRFILLCEIYLVLYVKYCISCELCEMYEMVCVKAMGFYVLSHGLLLYLAINIILLLSWYSFFILYQNRICQIQVKHVTILFRSWLIRHLLVSVLQNVDSTFSICDIRLDINFFSY